MMFSAIFIAQLAAATESLGDQLKPYGLVGVVVGFLMGRDIWRDLRESKRQEAREKNQDDQMGKLITAAGDQTAALNHLTRALTLEVLTRPDVAKRAKQEAQELQEAIAGK